MAKPKRAEKVICVFCTFTVTWGMGGQDAPLQLRVQGEAFGRAVENSARVARRVCHNRHSSAASAASAAVPNLVAPGHFLLHLLVALGQLGGLGRVLVGFRGGHEGFQVRLLLLGLGHGGLGFADGRPSGAFRRWVASRERRFSLSWAVLVVCG